LDSLRGTIIEAGLRPEKEERRSLLDFVDEGGVEGLLGAIKGVIDDVERGFEAFQDGEKRFNEETLRVRRTLNSEPDSPAG